MANEPQKPQEHDEETAKSVLRRYIFHERTFSERLYVPHRVPPEVASRYIREEVKNDAQVEHIHNACETARFYRLRDCLKHFADFLSRNIREAADVHRSAESIDVLGDLGGEKQQGLAYDEWKRLTVYRRLDQVGARMIQSFFHLGPDAQADPLEKELEKQYQEALKNVETATPRDPDAETLDELAHRTLVRTVAAKRQKDMVVTDKRVSQRAFGLARIYLGMVDFATLGQDWAAYELIAEAKERSTPEAVVEAVRQAFSEFEKTNLGDEDPVLAAETKEETTARAYDAIAFFGGKLTEKEQQFLAGDVPPNPFTPS